MLIGFFRCLRRAGLPVSINEQLLLLDALSQDLAFGSLEEFYLLARTCLIKDERHYDKFDRAFGAFFDGLDSLDGLDEGAIPPEWVQSDFLKALTEAQKAQVQSWGGLDKLMAAFNERLKEQKERHQGGNKWIGTGGTSAFGNSGYHPGGIRVGGESRNKSAAKVWDKREYRNFDDEVELGTRNIKMALRKLRRFARNGAAEELDLDDTIRSTANNGGMLDVKLVPQRHNAIKVLLFFDVGGSMDPHIQMCEELFSACRSEFKHLEYYYFHNFIYDFVWRDNRRRHAEVIPLLEVLRTYPKDYKVIFIGDASMGPYEISHRYGSVEQMNEEPGAAWMQRLTEQFERVIWLNPEPQSQWRYTQSIAMVQQLVSARMYPLTLEGLERGIQTLLTGR
ncbi:vWA domain-containing protein [Ferrimonas pelagia]|uniref:VWA domain-containing protein n=1 Tax=Ferrimonas pelagia TaxID=1177826 RepID=A0ABP9EF39_9GAMM